MNNAIKVNHISVFYDEKLVLNDISVIIPQGCICAIVGPNGAGKTTFIKAILGLVDSVSGSVSLFQHTISYVPQRRSIDWDFPVTVLDVVLMGRYQALGWFARPGKKDKELAFEALKRVKLQDYADRPIAQLSGGERQRIFIARSLLQDADIYIMDEPFVGVDALTEQTIVGVLKELRAQGKTILVVHHDLQTMQEYFDWMILLNKSLIASGPLHEVFIRKHIAQAYGAIPVFCTWLE